MQVAVLFTVKLLWDNIIGLLRKLVIGKVHYYYCYNDFEETQLVFFRFSSILALPCKSS